MRKLLPIVAPTVCLILALGNASADDNKSGKRLSTPKKDTTITTPAVTTPPPAAAFLSPAGEGRRAWLKYNCYGCHGMRAAGAMGPNVVHDGGDVGEAVKEGESGGMPPYGKLISSTEISNLRAYLNSIGTTAEPTFNDWWVPVPTK